MNGMNFINRVSIKNRSCNKQTTSLIAVDLGYQSCWVEGSITDSDNIGGEMANILNVPDEYELVCYLPIGVHSETISSVRKKEFWERAFVK